MRPGIPFERAKQIIQGWYDGFCKEYGKDQINLEIEEEDDRASRAYKVSNPVNGTRTSIFWSTVSDYEDARGGGIPGDLKFGIWDAFRDLE
ncbi:MAG: hypothetical protein ABII06_05315 [Pseudomonadota bacterium]